MVGNFSSKIFQVKSLKMLKKIKYKLKKTKYCGKKRFVWTLHNFIRKTFASNCNVTTPLFSIARLVNN